MEHTITISLRRGRWYADCTCQWDASALAEDRAGALGKCHTDWMAKLAAKPPWERGPVVRYGNGRKNLWRAVIR